MRFSKGFFSLLLFLAAGALIGGILGQVLGSANLVGLMPFLTETYEIFHIQNIALNLGIMQIHFGIRFAPNLISILGILSHGGCMRSFEMLDWKALCLVTSHQ